MSGGEVVQLALVGGISAALLWLKKVRLDDSGTKSGTDLPGWSPSTRFRCIAFSGSR
jgi:hypothetical protein